MNSQMGGRAKRHGDSITLPMRDWSRLLRYSKMGLDHPGIWMPPKTRVKARAVLRKLSKVLAAER
jgi:hypothetical protein